MRIIHAKALSALSAQARGRLEKVLYGDSASSLREMQALFPNHIVRANHGHIRLLTKDGTILLDAFRDENPGVSWTETTVPLKVTI